MAKPKDVFAAELEARIKTAQKNAKVNRWIAYAVITGTIASSFAALMMSVSKWDPTQIGIVAIIPAFLTALDASFRFDQRANWFYRRVNALRRIAAKLHYSKDGPADIEALAQQVCDLVDNLSEDFPHLAAADIKPPRAPLNR